MSTARIIAIALIATSLTVAFASGVAAGTEAEPETSESINATLVSAYPNPVARGDPGEFVAVRFDRPTNTSGWTLTDGKTTARLPNRTIDGTVAFSMKPDHARNHTEHPVAALSGRLLLADDGDRLELQAGERTVDSARYRRAPVSEVWHFETETWQPIGATDHDPIRTDGGEATVFVLPDAPEETVRQLRTAEDRILVAGYTFSSERIADTLEAAASDGVDVRVLLDGAPVGGVSDRQARKLDRLTDAGVTVRVLTGSHTRYRHHHAKYAVIDDRALVSTENFKPAGTGGMSSRGWSVVLNDDETAAELTSVYERDWTWRAATPWNTYRDGRTFTDADPALGSFEPRHEPERVTVDSATLLVAPDNAGDELVSMMESADDRVLVQQVRIDSRENRLLRAAMDAADRGVRVRIHLSDSWYVESENAALVEWLNRRAETEEWDLEARVDDADGYGKIHTKGVVVDDVAVVGSLNWVRSAKSDNRKLLVALEGSEPAEYYASVFESDWSGDERRAIPAGVLAVVAVAGSGTLLLLRRIEFVGKAEPVTDWKW